MSTAAQIAANQANAQLSTGPKTEAGKAASSQNNFRHGLSGAFVIQTWENADHYYELLDGLRREHQPITPTEALLVERMAQHWWLGQRAVRLQEFCFHETAPILNNDGSEKELALYIRYQTTHERAFSKCLSDLLKLRGQLLREQRGFKTQLRQEAAERRKQQMHEARMEALKTKTEATKSKTVKPAPPVSTASPAIDSNTLIHESEPQPIPQKQAA